MKQSTSRLHDSPRPKANAAPAPRSVSSAVGNGVSAELAVLPLRELNQVAADALRATTQATWPEKARYLQELFGQQLTAAITGVSDAKTVARWVRGQEPQTAHRQRLTNAFHVAKVLELGMSRETARAWFLGMNPDLDDELPAQVIAEDIEDGGKRVMRAARGFLASS